MEAGQTHKAGYSLPEPIVFIHSKKERESYEEQNNCTCHDSGNGSNCPCRLWRRILFFDRTRDLFQDDSGFYRDVHDFLYRCFYFYADRGYEGDSYGLEPAGRPV
jgi:hypothetical protein